MTGYDPALSTSELSKKISALGIKKANTKGWQLIILGVLAGLYIGFGGHLFLVAMEQGMGKLIAGAAFSVGLTLVVVAGAELFTGNIIMIVSTILSLHSIGQMLKNWISVYFGNFLGSFLLVLAVWYSGLLGSTGHLNSLGEMALKISQTKLGFSFLEVFLRGILCNMLVILAIVMATIAKDIISKIFCIILPIMTFVASGFEHCVANMYLIPLGQLAGGASGTDLIGMFRNIIPATLGNIVGGLFILVIHPNRIRQIMYVLRNKNTFQEKVSRKGQPIKK